MYHKVDVRPEIGITSIHPRQFKRQIEFLLKQGYSLVTLKELQTKYANDPSAVALTFDDAYQNIHKYAFPILKQYGVAATVFVITGFIGSPNRWDAQYIARRAYRHLNYREIEELIRAGWRIESHGISHRGLNTMSRDEIKSEIVASKKMLEERFGVEVSYFAPPFGKITPRIRRLATEAGYQGICGFYPGRYYCRPLPEKQIPRLAVYRFESRAALRRKLSPKRALRIEIIKQNMINFCANATILVNSLR